MLRVSQAVTGSPRGQRQGVFARPDDVTFVDTRQPFQLDTGAMLGPAHQVPGRQPQRWQLHADALDPAPPRTAGTMRLKGQPMVWLSAIGSVHQTPPDALAVSHIGLCSYAECLVRGDRR